MRSCAAMAHILHKLSCFLLATSMSCSSEFKSRHTMVVDNRTNTTSTCGNNSVVNASATQTTPSVVNLASSAVVSKKRAPETILRSDDVTDEAERLAAKRAYNRECATRARQRGKDLITNLEQKVKDLQDDKSELRRTVTALENEVSQLKKKNQSLLLEQQMMTSTSVGRNNRDTLSSTLSTARVIEQLSQTQREQLQFIQAVQSNRNASSLLASSTKNTAPFMGYQNFY